MTIAIELDGLAKVYKTPNGDVDALRDVSLSISEGERVGILGENGAGKSTLLQIIAGLASPSSGRRMVEGRIHAALSLGVGLREELSGRENLYLEAEIQGVDRGAVDGFVENMIAFAELGHFIDEPVRTYSSGMKSRLTFASLVFVDPEILLLDETLSAGDQFFQRKASQAVQDLCDRGKIVIIVSHGIRGLADMSTRCIWLHKGRVRMDGDPHEVAEAYLDYERIRIERQAMSDLHARELNWSASSRQRITSLSINGVDDNAELIDPDRPAAIAVSFETDLPLRTPVLMVSIERMDGILTTESRFELTNVDELAKGRYYFEAEVERLLLQPSYYLLHAELIELGEPCARRTVTFRTHSTTEYIGGTPMLFQPIVATPARSE